MADLSVKYMGLQLKNPIIVGSSGLSQSTGDLCRLEESGVGAVVIRSMFEEQIYLDADYKRLNPNDKNLENIEHFETLDYTEKRVRREYLSSFVKTIEEAKEKLHIPIISSINCISASGWTSFATRLQDAGSDAIELNIAIQPFSSVMSAADIEQLHLEIIYKVREAVDIPVAVKISPYFSDMSRVIDNIAQTGVNGIVLFNRFISPDINIEKMKVIVSSRYSSSCEMSNPLRWVALKSETTPCDLCASTGIHSGADVIKILLAGGAATQIVSTIYKNGQNQVENMINDMNKWMETKGYDNIEQFAGILRHQVETNTNTPASYERMQFMKYYQ